MRTDGQTVMTKLIVAFCNFAKAPKKFRCPCAHLEGVWEVEV